MEDKTTRLDELLEECGRLHGHICPGQLLGVRMALLGCKLIGLDEGLREDRKKLVVWVEIDRCMTDALSAVTGARLGRRSLKFLDYGKVAATFLNTQTGEAVRIAALDESRSLADSRYPAIENKKERQLLAYKEASDDELFKIECVRVNYGELDAPGHARKRLPCTVCGEGVNDGREVIGEDGLARCVHCSYGGYYQKLEA